MSDSSNNAGDLSMSCSVSSVESEESQVSDVEGCLEIVKPYQFEPIASDSLAESDTEAQDDDSGDEERFCSRDWYEFACMTIKDNPSVFQKVHYDILL